MKILDETGAVVENPDLTLGYLVTTPNQWSTRLWKVWRK